MLTCFCGPCFRDCVSLDRVPVDFVTVDLFLWPFNDIYVLYVC